MALTADTAITGLTVAKVEQITGVGDLANLDEGNSTAATKLTEATNALRTWVRGRWSVDPDNVTNDTDFLHAAAYWVVAQTYAGRGTEEGRQQAALYEEKFEAELLRLTVQTSDTSKTLNPRRLPKVYNPTAVSIAPGIDNRRRGQTISIFEAT